MKSYFKIGILTVWAIAISNLLLTIFAIISEFYHLDSNNILLLFWFIILPIGWIIFINDILQNKIYNKTFWIFSMFILPSISQVVYLIQRHKLLRT